MHFYILDQGNLSDISYERCIVELQSLLTQFRISGETGRVTQLRSIRDLVNTASSRGTRNLIACGNDDTFNLMLAHLQGKPFTLGYIPLEPDTNLGKILGLRNMAEAVKNLAARRVEQIDVAAVDNAHFIGQIEFGLASSRLKHMTIAGAIQSVSIPKRKVVMRIDDSYTITVPCLGGMICNARPSSRAKSGLCDPTDGLFDLFIIEELSKMDIWRYRKALANSELELLPKTSVIKCRSVDFIEPRGLPLTIAGKVFTKSPTRIEMRPYQLRIIVGKDRTF